MAINIPFIKQKQGALRYEANVIEQIPEHKLAIDVYYTDNHVCGSSDNDKQLSR